MSNTYLVQRQCAVEAPSCEVYRVVTGLGCQRGWLAFNWLWQLRAAVDRLIGGIGMRCERRHPGVLRVNDTIDFWRVEALEPNRLLRLHAEMILPGQGWLQFEIETQSDQACCLFQTAIFTPTGLSGRLYWFILTPIHSVIFTALIHKIAELAEHNYWVSSEIPGQDS